ncbi:MAG: hypothetical protein JWM89_1819 [Acidimicrobiales bacterium]|nr:hypothetical protein [Acidimicrobiales bacterium]
MTYDPFLNDDSLGLRPGGCARTIAKVATAVVVVIVVAEGGVSLLVRAAAVLAFPAWLAAGFVWSWRRGDLHRHEFDGIDARAAATRALEGDR